MKTHKVRLKKRNEDHTQTPIMAYGGQSNYALDTGRPGDYLKSDQSFFDYNDVVLNTTLKPVDRDEANIEAELGETIVADFSGTGKTQQLKVGGKKHSQGGTPLNVPDNAFIFSDTKDLKMKGSELTAFGKSEKSNKKYTPADIAKQYDINKYQAILDDPKSDHLSRKTASIMINNYEKKLSQLALVQEAKKGFENGIPEIAISYCLAMSDGLNTQAGDGVENEQGMFRKGGQLSKFVKGGKSDSFIDIDPWKGDKLVTNNPKTGTRSNNWNKSKYSKEEWDAIKSELGYTGPNNNIAFQTYLNENYPDIIDEFHSEKSGFGMPSVTKKKIDGLLGVRWDAIVDKIRDTPSPRTTPDTATPKSIPLSPYTPVTKLESETSIPVDNRPVPGEYDPQGNDPGPFDYMTPDKATFVAGLRNRAGIKKYMPWEATVTAQTVDPTFYDPNRELANNNEQMNTQMDYNAMFSGPQSLGARNSAVAGHAAVNAANIISNVDNKNVGVANQFAEINAEIMNKLMYDRADRNTRLYDKTVIANQQYDNAVREADNQILKSGINAWNNRSQLSMLNDTNPYYNIDPNTGRIVFKRGKGIGSSTPGSNNQPTWKDFYNKAIQEGRNEASAEAYANKMIDGNKAVYTDKNNDGYWDAVRAHSAGYNGIIGPKD